ncbi:hypothetical protein ACROYT_G025391 [Oculina patagonica]
MNKQNWSGIAVDELTKWSNGVEAQQETDDKEITHLSETLAQINYKTSLQAKKCEEELAERDRDKQLQFECIQLEQKMEEARKSQVSQICQRKHHTSICNSVSKQLMTATSMERPNVIFPAVVVEVLGVKCRALLDTGAGSSYASAALLDGLKIRPHQREVRQIEMMSGY